MDHDQHDADLTTLIDLHAQRRRLDILIDARRRRGKPTHELEELLAINRSKASHFALLLSLHAPATQQAAGLAADGGISAD